MPDTYAPDTGDTSGSDFGPYAPGQAPQDIAAQRAQAALAAAQGARGADTSTPSAAPAAAPQLPLENADQNMSLDAMKRDSWGNKVYHGVLAALGGKYDTQYIPTENGVVAKQVAQTPGQQWKRIISGALTGYAGAAAAGTQGPGGIARGLGGGIQAGYGERIREDQQNQKTADTQFSQAQDAAMNTARKSLLASQISKMGWDLQYEQKTARESDLKNEANLEAMIEDAKASGGRDLGVFKTFAAAREAFANEKTLHDDHAQGQLVPVLAVGDDGKIQGVHVAWVPKAWQQAKATRDYTYTIDLGKDPNTGKERYDTATVGKSTNMSNSELQDFIMARSDVNAKQHMEDLKEQREEQVAKADIGAKGAQADESRATAAGKRAETAALYGPQGAAGGTPAGGAAPAGGPDSYIDMIGHGQMDIGILRRLVAKNPNLLNLVHQRYPDFDQGKVENYFKTVKDYGPGGPIGTRINNASTALVHLNDLMKLNTNMSHIATTNAHTAYTTKAQQIAGEIAAFYKANNIPFEKGLEDQLLSTLPGNRAAAAQTMAKSMGEKLDEFESQWGEAAPSAAYKPLMPRYSPQATAARAALDPEFAKRGQMVRVQIPGHLPGQVPAASLEQFRKDNPTAQVL